MTKRFRAKQDALYKVDGTIRKNKDYVEEVLTEVGKCCHVDLCNGVIRHRDPVTGQIEKWAIISGVFGLVNEDPTNPSQPKWVSTEIYYKNPESAMGRTRMKYVEDVLNEQSTCCGVDCCGSNMIRLPNHDEGVIYEFGASNGVATGPTAVAGLTPSKKSKREYQLQGDFYVDTFKKKRGNFGRYAPVKYFEEIQEGMIDNGYYGFDCCEGSIFLPNLDAQLQPLGTYYKITIVSDAFVLTQVDKCGVPV